MPERAKPLTDADVETMAQALDSGALYADDIAVISWFATYGPELLKRARQNVRLSKPTRTPVEGMYPPGWPKCACGDYVLDGKATCGRVECLR